jgi:hypothetical protein
MTKDLFMETLYKINDEVKFSSSLARSKFKIIDVETRTISSLGTNKTMLIEKYTIQIIPRTSDRWKSEGNYKVLLTCGYHLKALGANYVIALKRLMNKVCARGKL